MRLLKSVGAIIAGFLVVFVLSVATDVALHLAGVMPDTPGLFDTKLLLLATAYRTVYTILGGFVTAKLAPRDGMKHAVVLGIIGMIAGSAGAVANAALGPAWYAWGLVVEAVPCAWIGAKLAHR